MVMNPMVESVKNHLKLKQTKEKNQRFQLSFVKIGFYFKGDEQKKGMKIPEKYVFFFRCLDWLGTFCCSNKKFHAFHTMVFFGEEHLTLSDGF